VIAGAVGRFKAGFAAAPWLIGLGFVLGLSLGAATLNWFPYFGMTDTVARLKPAKQAAGAWEENFDEAEGLRVEETDQCIDAVRDERDAGQARLDAYIEAMNRRDALFNREPDYDQDHCPVRELLRARQLFQPVIPDAAGTCAPGDGCPDLRSGAERTVDPG
jgi:hypothetical protein